MERGPSGFSFHEIKGDRMLVYHGSGGEVRVPEVRKRGYSKDFSWGFYCTRYHTQAERWAKRHNRNGETPTVNCYEYREDPTLNVQVFPEMSDEWLDFIAACRSGADHPYDIVDGPMADDEIWNYVEDYLHGDITRAAFWELARFRHPTHQISFHTERALGCLHFVEAKECEAP